MDESMFAAFAFMGAFAFMAVLIAIALYVIFAIGLMNIANRKGIENAWLAFIPIAQLYILGLIIKELKIFSFEVPSPELVLPIAGVATIVLGAIPFIGFILSIANIILNVAALYTLYLMYIPAKAMIYTILGIIFPILTPFFVFSIRNEEPVL